MSRLRQAPAAVGASAAADARWTWPLAATAAAVAGLFGLYRDNVADIVGIWSTAAYAHCVFVVPIALWLAWQRRGRLAVLSPQPAPEMLLLALPAGALWLVARAAHVDLGEHLALLLLLEVAFLSLLGRRVFVALLLPFAYLVFLVPVGDSAVPVLQEITARFAVWGLRLSGVPVFAQGPLISIPSQDFRVAEACAGLAYVLVALTLGIPVAADLFAGWRRRAGFVTLFVALAILTNCVRAYAVMLATHLGVDASDHRTFGTVLFVAVLAPFVVVARRFSDAGAARPAAADRRIGAPPPAARTRTAAVVCMLLLLVALPRAYAARDGGSGAAAEAALVVPAPGSAWSCTEGDEHGWRAGVDRVTVATCTDGRRHVRVFAAFLARQERGRKITGFEPRLLDRLAAVEAKSWSVSLPAPTGTVPLAAKLLVARDSQRFVLVSSYRVGDGFVAGGAAMRFRQAFAELVHHRRGAIYIGAVAPVTVDADQAEADLRDFWSELSPPASRQSRMAGG
jgi:exosortase A